MLILSGDSQNGLYRSPEKIGYSNFAAFCGKLRSSKLDRSRRLLVDGYIALCNQEIEALQDGDVELGFQLLFSNIPITRLDSDGFCGSGGCSSSFVVWQKSELGYYPAAECNGDSFSLRVSAAGKPETLYCLNQHANGCHSSGNYYYTANFNSASGFFSHGPKLVTKVSTTACKSETARLTPGENSSLYTPLEVFTPIE